MGVAKFNQKFQDWFTQQWAIWWGRKLNPYQNKWLMGPLGSSTGKSSDFIFKLAEDEDLLIHRKHVSQGLIPDMKSLNLSIKDYTRLSPAVKDFYEHTATYNLKLKVHWNPLFRLMGKLVNRLFSQRINQLNIPTANILDSNLLDSEIITLSDAITNEIRYTIWYRTFKYSGKVVYSGIYSTCVIPSGETCVKAVFPLPNGNATVIMKPEVGANGELILKSAGSNFQDPGFYFVLKDSKDNLWAEFISSFKDILTVYIEENNLFAKQRLTLWGIEVLTFHYSINKKNN